MTLGGFKESTPATPGTNQFKLYERTSDNRIAAKTEEGIEHILSANGLDRNYLLNGGFSVIQRLAAALTSITGPSLTARVFTADKWGHTVGNVTTPQFQQVDTIGTPEVGITARYYGTFKQLTTAAKTCISQVIPATETARLRGRTVRLQCKMKIPASGGSNRNMKFGLLQLTAAGTFDTMPASFISAFNADTVNPTFGTNLSLITPTLIESTGSASGSCIQCPITSSWIRFSGTFVIPTDCKNLVLVVFNDTVGAASDAFSITEVDMHDGNEIFDWMEMSFDYVLTKCQRYFAKSFPYATVPAQNAGITTGALGCIQGITAAAVLAGVWTWRFPVEMFKTPTITLFNAGAANAQARRVSGAAAADQTATVTQNITSSQTGITCTGDAAGVVGNQIIVHATADAEI